MVVCTHGSRPDKHVNLWEIDGDCPPMTTGGRWRDTTVALVKIPATKVKSHIKPFWLELAQDSMPSSAVAVPLMASMRDWKPTAFTGPHPSPIRPADSFTTLLEAGKLSIVKVAARSKEPFPFVVSGSKDSTPD